MSKLDIKSQLVLISLLLTVFVMQPSTLLADTGSAESNIFSMDTRENLPPDGPWQLLTKKGNTYNEDILIDNSGKVWTFYMRDQASGSPVYMKILSSDGYVFKSETPIANATSIQSGNRQTVRACYNSATGDVWVTIQGDRDGVARSFFMVFNSSGNVKINRTELPGANPSYYPKVVCDQNNVMWFAWQTDSVYSKDSVPMYACYNTEGALVKDATLMHNVGSISWTDIAVDANNRIWLIYETGRQNVFTRIINNDATHSEFKAHNIRYQAESQYDFYPKRVTCAHPGINRVYLFMKSNTLNDQLIKIYDLDGDEVGEITHVGDVIWGVNEKNRLEVIKFESGEYLKAEFDANSGSTISEPKWSTIIENVNSSVLNGYAFNSVYEKLKAYLVQTEPTATQYYLTQIVKKPEIYVTPKSLDFGFVKLNVPSTKTFLVENVGTAKLSVTNVIPDDAQFSVEQTAFDLDPEERLQIDVTFRPTLLGVVDANLNIQSNDPDSSSYIVPLQGAGRDVYDQKIVVDSDTLDFGDVPTNGLASNILKISNEGEKVLNVDSLKFGNEHFTSQTDTLHISPGATRSVRIDFSPADNDTARGLLHIYNDDPTSWKKDVYLIGVGRPPVDQKIAISPDTLDFGPVAMEKTADLTLSVINEGEKELVITSVSANNEVFTPETTEFSVEPGQTYPLKVTFAPTAIANFKGRLTINSNDPEQAEIEAVLIGEGRKVNEPDIAVSANAVDFGSVKVGLNVIKYVKVSNLGDQPLVISKIEVSGSQFSTDTGNFTLEAEEFRWLGITYKPDSMKTNSGEVRISSNDPDTEIVTIELSGTGAQQTPAKIAVDPLEIDFDTVAVNYEVVKWLSITNIGQERLEITDVYSNDPQFRVTIEEFSLNSGYQKYIPVYFKPSDEGVIHGDVFIDSNDPSDETVRIPLSGMGRLAKEPEIYTYPTTVEFGTIAVGDSGIQTLLVKNQGEKKLTIKNIISNNEQFYSVQKNIVLGALETRYLQLVFKPGSSGSVVTDLTIRSDAVNDTARTVTLQGAGRTPIAQKIHWNPEELDFGSIPIGSALKKSVWIYNQGEQLLTVTGMTIDESQFTANLESFTIEPGKFRQIDVTFKPITIGAFSGNLNIKNDDSENPSVLISLRGTGRDLYDPVIHVDYEKINFGSVAVGDISSKNIYIYNQGEKELKVSGATTLDPQFTVSTGVFTVPPKSSKLLIISYKPAVYDTANTQLEIVSNTQGNDTTRIELSGRGRSLLPQTISVNSDTIDFGTVARGTPYEKNFLVLNAGEATLEISSMTTTDEHFILNANSFSLEPGYSRSITVTFESGSVREYVEKVHILSNDVSNPDKEVVLKATTRDAIPPTAKIDADSVKFGVLGVGLWTSQKLTIQNTGESTLRLREITIDDPNFGVEITELDIDPDSAKQIEIIFAPSLPQKFVSSINMESNNPEQEIIEIPLVGTGRNRLDQKMVISPEKIEFQDIAIGKTADQYLTISNQGEKPLLIQEITSDNFQFQVDTTNFPVNPLSQQAVKISYSPVVVGEDSAEITILSDDPTEPVKTMKAYGSSRSQIPQEISVSATSLEFEETGITQTRSRILIISNVGDYDLEINRIATNDEQFTVSDTIMTIASLQSDSLEVTFMPTEAGETEADLTIYSNDPSNPAVQVSLSGTGKLLSDQQISVSPRQIDFGAIPISDSSRQQVWVINLGEKTLTIDSVSIDDAHFSIDATSFNVGPSTSEDRWVTFKPTDYDEVQANMRIKSNDPANPYIDVSLSGSGRDLKDQQIAIVQTDLDFGEVGWGRKLTKEVSILNEGEKTLKITDITSTDTSLFKVDVNSFDVAGGHAHILNIIFTPRVFGSDSSKTNFYESLTVFSNDAENNEITIDVKGVGRPLTGPVISIPTDALDFGTVAVGRTKTKRVEIENKGEKELIISSIDVEDPEKIPQFQIGNEDIVIPPETTGEAEITYAPTQVDEFETRLVFTSNDTTSPSESISLKAKSENYAGPVIVVEQDRVDFGDLVRGAWRYRSIYVMNDGPKLLQVTDLTLSNNTNFTVSMAIKKIGPGEQERVDIGFNPTAVNDYTAVLSISSDDEYQPVLDISLSGSGILDTNGTLKIADLDWTENYAPFGKDDFNGQSEAWFVKDFEVYSAISSGKLRIAYQKGIQVFLNGSMVYDGQDDDATFAYWTLDDLDLKDFLIYGRNRIAVRLFADNDGDGGFDAELTVNGTIYIIPGQNNQGNALAKWWHFTGNGSPAAMSGTSRVWYAGDYGLVGQDSTIGSWSFQEGAGDVIYDASRYGRKAELFNITWATGLNGWVLKFNGTSSYIALEANLNTLPLTMQFWLKPGAKSDKNQVLISNSSDAGFGHGLYLDSNLRLVVTYYNGKRTFDNTGIELNTWCYISTRFVKDSIYVYVNGRLIDGIEYEPKPPTGFNHCIVGKSMQDGDGWQPFAGEISNIQFYNVHTTPNVVPSVIQAVPELPAKAIAAQAVTAQFRMEPPIAEIDNGWLYYRPGGAVKEDSVNIEFPFQSDSVVTATVPAGAVTVRGLAYRIELNTSFGKVVYPSENSDAASEWITVQTKGENSALATYRGIYQMVSVPYELGSKSIKQVLNDDMGDYDPYEWRLYSWISSGNSSGAYIENETEQWPENERNFTRGKAFWLVTAAANKTFDADSGYSASDEEPFEMTLQRGWNQIASPFPFTVNWDDVTKDAEISNLYFYNPEMKGYEVNQKRLNPWQGYFVNNQLPYSVILKIPAKEASAIVSKSVAENQFLLENPKTVMALNISAKCGQLMDRDNLIAVTQAANNEWDPADAPEPPPIGKYVSFAVDNSQWENRPGAYAMDVRPVGERGYIWNVRAACEPEMNSSKFSMDFENQIDLPEDLLLFAFDLEDEIAINLKKQTSYNFDLHSDAKTERKFKFVFGDEAFVHEQSEGIPLEPLSFELMQNFPNPFNPTTMIHFSIPKKAHTRLAIYNVLGQEVAVLIDEVVKARQHQILWDGTNRFGLPVASGLYFIKLKTEAQVQVRKMMLIR